MLLLLPSRHLFPPGSCVSHTLGKPLTRWRYKDPLTRFRGLAKGEATSIWENSEGPEPGATIQGEDRAWARPHSQKPNIHYTLEPHQNGAT